MSLLETAAYVSNETQWNGQNRVNQQNMPIYGTYNVT